MIYKLFKLPTGPAILAMAVIALSLAVACGSAATAIPAITVSESTAGDDGIRPILATTLLRVGSQRIAFLLTTSDSLIKSPEAIVTSTYLGDGEAPGERKKASFHLWPYGVRGAYTTALDFERPGPWQLDITVETLNGPGRTQLKVDVAEQVAIPEIGTIPPFGPSKTVHTVERLSELTTAYTPDPDLYQMTIPEAVISGRPSVIVFASPAFCTSPTCGPQVETVSELKELHQVDANFIHVELYDNPEEIQGDLSKALLVDLVDQWGFSSIPHWFNESWTFVLGKDGRIAQRFEGFATLEELESELQAALTAA